MYLAKLDFATTVLFFFEAVIKIIAFGFVLNGPQSYLRSTWNTLDFTIVLTSLITLLLPAADELSSVKVIRMVRMLKPIRVISKNDGLKISIQALFVSIPSVANLLVIVILFMGIFAIIGVNLFKGKY